MPEETDDKTVEIQPPVIYKSRLKRLKESHEKMKVVTIYDELDRDREEE